MASLMRSGLNNKVLSCCVSSSFPMLSSMRPLTHLGRKTASQLSWKTCTYETLWCSPRNWNFFSRRSLATNCYKSYDRCHRTNLGYHTTRLLTVPKSSVTFVRCVGQSGQDQRNKTTLIYISAMGVFMIGMAYAGVPLYRIFCQATGRGGQAIKDQDVSKVETMEPIKDRLIRVRFNADVASSMQWNFRPQQTEVRVVPGETALAFYSAKNPTSKPIVGISTYNVVPFEAGQYFNKIQCFCFEEQRLNPHEQVDMPVFFYIDPEWADDPKMQDVHLITLSYTFFEAKDGIELPIPDYVKPHVQPSAA